MGEAVDKKEKYKRLVRFSLSTLDMLIMTAFFTYFWFSYYHRRDVIGGLYFKWGHYALITLYAVLIILFARMFGALRVGYLRVVDVLYSQILTVIFVNAVTYIQLDLIGRWKFGTHLIPILWMTGYQIIAACLWVILAQYLYKAIYPPRDVLLIYGVRSPRSIVHKIETRKDKYIIKEMVSIVDCDDDYIKEKILQYSSVMIGDIPSQYRNKYLKYCFEHNTRCYFVPKISDIMMRSSETINLFDTALQLCRNQGLSAEQQLVKRVVDIICSTIMLIPGLPIMAIIAIAIKAYDHGPILYTQKRLTLNGEVFDIYKFRSMTQNSEKDGARLCAQGDMRVTPVGHIIRNLHLDELPQLFNIFKGDMSLVGPRPERPEIAEQYKEVIPEFDYRLKVKAGLTGYAQVYGKYNTTPYDKLKLDLFYIENYSLFLDIKLLFMTFKILFQKENTEGVDANQKTAAERMDKTVEEEAAEDKNRQ